MGDRSEALGAVEVPTVVIHGDSDPLIQPEGGRATAQAIAGAELDMVEGMGHDLPVELYERFSDRIAGLVQRAEAGRSDGELSGTTGRSGGRG